MILGSPNILIIEDNAFVLRLLQNHLTKNLNAGVFTAIDREEGLNKLKNEKIDILMLDMFLQNKTTLDLMENIKKNPATGIIPIVVITMIGDKENADAARKLGIKDFIVKGEASLKDTLSIIRKYL